MGPLDEAVLMEHGAGENRDRGLFDEAPKGDVVGGVVEVQGGRSMT
jgi:hypothetical protein